VLLYGLGVCCQMLWRGRIPISNRIWWQARGASFSKVDGRPSRETILVQMIELRRRKDSRLRYGKRPSDWPMFQLWETTEAVLLNTVEDYAWLKDAGLSDHAALQRLEAVDAAPSMPTRETVPLRELVTKKLRMVDPNYLDALVRDGLPVAHIITIMN
jgi:hypothetical protein